MLATRRRSAFADGFGQGFNSPRLHILAKAAPGAAFALPLRVRYCAKRNSCNLPADAHLENRKMVQYALGLREVSFERAKRLVRELGYNVNAVKLHETWINEGQSLIYELRLEGAKRIWLDQKLHDTPPTVAACVKAYARQRVDILTVHASGGVEMLRAALESAGDMEIWAVTLLSSLEESTVAQVYGTQRTPYQISYDLACLAKEAGIRTVVCSAKEIGQLSSCPELKEIAFVVPGTRLSGVPSGGQRRTSTPAEAVRNGAAWIVLESEIIFADDPRAALKAAQADVTQNAVLI
jgi:orotidine-5'-phosphate decarboxylase